MAFPKVQIARSGKARIGRKVYLTRPCCLSERRLWHSSLPKGLSLFH